MSEFGALCELKTTTSKYREERVEEFYTRSGNTRTINRFFFPDSRRQKHLVAEQQMVIVGLDDDFYQECSREEFDPRLYSNLEEKFAAAKVAETSTLHVGTTKMETVYYEQGVVAAKQDAA
ncbi:hypothetical protein [Geoalkalibacter subterraneus]|uniref:Uncharacterized protein n=1 Tax=Geoalkalibacter subterraneus TaxID=483547 RepID=A0A0B5FXE4_9BACT|nr:hypothetical protein [Geoalkalibacter subterraneus]AJF08261.1 hypothetical protein GSUB_17430 [Geoalkalibacter subterraneus]